MVYKIWLKYLAAYVYLNLMESLLIGFQIKF